MDCGGVLGPPLIRWLLDHTDAAIVGGGRSHEALASLLGEPRFSFYTLDGYQESGLVSTLIENADTVVDLGPLEQPVSEHPSTAELEEELRVRTEIVRVCAERGRRLVHVSSAEVYGRRWPLPVGPGPITDADRQVREDEAPLVSGPVGDEDLSAAHERMTQHLIYTYGETEALDFVILRVFDVLGEHLETLPERERRHPVSAIRDALLTGEARTVRLEPEDLYVRTLVYAVDAAEAIGMVVDDEQGHTAGEVLNIGDPANRVSPGDLARLVLARYRERHWDGRSALPRIAEVEVSVADPQAQLRLPSLEKVVRLVDWRPRWSLPDAIDAALAGLFEASAQVNGTGGA